MKEIPSKYPTFQVFHGQFRKFVRLSNKYFDNANEDWKILVPKERRVGIIRPCHDVPTSGHFGIYKTLHRLRQKYF